MIDWEFIQQKHVEKLLALGAKKEDLPRILAAEEKYGMDYTETLAMKLEAPDEAAAIEDEAAIAGYTYDDLPAEGK